MLPSDGSYAIGPSDEITELEEGVIIMLAKLLTAAAVASLAATPVLASSASSHSPSKARAATSSENESEMRPAVIVGVLATIAVIAGAVAFANGDDTPDSP